MNHKIAVLMSIYQGDNLIYLKQSVESILSQTEKDFILFIICDGPVNIDTEQYLAQLPNGHVIVTHRENNLGLAASLNELADIALKYGEFKYIARMDADDISMPNRFVSQSTFLDRQDDVDVVGSWYSELDSDGSVTRQIKLPICHDELLKFMARRSPLAHPTVMMRSEIFKTGYRYNQFLRYYQDYDLWLRLAAAGYRFANIPSSLLLFRSGDNFYKRRISYDRAINEAKIKYQHIKKYQLHSPLNYLAVIFVFLLRLSPPFIVKIAYRFLR